MLAIAVNALYASFRRRGTTRQLAGSIVTCVVSALLLLPALIWYSLRFSATQSTLSLAEIEVALAYVAIWGWLLPAGVTASYLLFTRPRTSSTSSLQIPRTKRTTKENNATALHPPRYQPGVEAPYVFGEDTPWGWLEHRAGRFQGQRLALMRSVVTIGRGEENDIWLDDDMASRRHAELAWENGRVYITDCDSLNGVLVNGRRIRGSALIQQGEMLEIGSHRFIFELARKAEETGEQEDPLNHHIWRNVDIATSAKNSVVAMTRPLDSEVTPSSGNINGVLPSSTFDSIPVTEWEETGKIDKPTPLPQTAVFTGVFLIQEGEMAGQSFMLDCPLLTIGRGIESDIVINDISISRRHAQVIRQPNGDYVQDLASRNGTKVNDEPLKAPRLLYPGDIVCIGNIHLEYSTMQSARTAPLPLILTPHPQAHTNPQVRTTSGPIPLSLPSKPRSEPTTPTRLPHYLKDASRE